MRVILLSAAVWVVLLAFIGAVCVTVGIWLVAGAGIACLVFGMLCLLGAVVLRAGMSRV